jgi:hypothetical protein
MMEAEHTSETLAEIKLRTQQYIPEDSEIYTRRRENLKYHKSGMIRNRLGMYNRSEMVVVQGSPCTPTPQG